MLTVLGFTYVYVDFCAATTMSESRHPMSTFSLFPVVQGPDSPSRHAAGQDVWQLQDRLWRRFQGQMLMASKDTRLQDS